MKISGYQFQSCFAPYLEKFIQEKQAAGFIYESEEWKLKHFDAFCAEESVTEPCLNRTLVKKWGTLRDGEALATCSARTSVIRQFALFLAPLGIEAYIPSNFYKAEKKVVHILSDAEIKAFFKEVDGYVPAIGIAGFYRLAAEYKVVFRLIYCCGLRISEARKLRWKDVGFKQGTIRILQSKGHKDRLIYMDEDLTELLRTYEKVLYDKYHCLSDWVFPARETDRCLSIGTIDKKFREFWALTPHAECCDKVPTVHCLRHTFVVKRMNLWMEEGIPLKEMLPFLSRYLGHQSPDETFYYYHSKTDHDATFMRMKEDAMGNGQLKPAYNLQHGVDSEYITWLTIGPHPTDTTTLIPFLKDAEEHLKFKYKNITADAGYESEENYLFLESNGQLPYIKPANYEISKTRKYKNDIGKVENMEYDSESDSYTCRNSKKLTADHIRHSKSKTGYVSEKTIYKCEDCSGCPYKSGCIKGNNCKTPMEERTKTLQVAKTFLKHRKEDLERILSEDGILFGTNRSIQAEGSFGDLKQDMQFRRYLSKGTTNVLAESILLAMARNLNKLHNKIQKGRTGMHLFPLKSA